MTDEERQRQMDFILNQQAQFSVNLQKHQEAFAANMQKLEETDARSNKRIDRLERILALAVRAYRRERKEAREKFNALITAQNRTDDAMAKLIESQRKRPNEGDTTTSS
jgi:hypothetical protein